MSLIGELSTHSEPFRGWWAAQDVYVHPSGDGLELLATWAATDESHLRAAAWEA